MLIQRLHDIHTTQEEKTAMFGIAVIYFLLFRLSLKFYDCKAAVTRLENDLTAMLLHCTGCLSRQFVINNSTSF